MIFNIPTKANLQHAKRKPRRIDKRREKKKKKKENTLDQPIQSDSQSLLHTTEKEVSISSLTTGPVQSTEKA